MWRAGNSFLMEWFGDIPVLGCRQDERPVLDTVVLAGGGGDTLEG